MSNYSFNYADVLLPATLAGVPLTNDKLKNKQADLSYNFHPQTLKMTVITSAKDVVFGTVC